jgi:hypothetical protein
VTISALQMGFTFWGANCGGLCESSVVVLLRWQIPR